MLSRRVNGALRGILSSQAIDCAMRPLSRHGNGGALRGILSSQAIDCAMRPLSRHGNGGALRGILSSQAIDCAMRPLSRHGNGGAFGGGRLSPDIRPLSRNLSLPPGTDTVKPLCPLPLWSGKAPAPHKLLTREQELHRSLAACVEPVAKIITVSEFIAKYASPENEEAAALDMHEAQCMRNMLREWESVEVDETLFLVLAICYIARLSSAERCACAATLGWEGGVAQLGCLVDFARQELLSAGGIQKFMLLDGAKQDEEASEHLELLWAKFCQSRNIQVGVTLETRNDIDMDFATPPPYRMPSNGEFRWSEKVTVKSDTRSTERSCYGVWTVPNLFGLVFKILKANFFVAWPVDRLGWNMLSTPSPHGHDEIRHAYAQLAHHPARAPEKKDLFEATDSMPLLVKDLSLLLQGIQNIKLLRSLVTERPPLSIVPHYHAIETCMRHARIWLGRCDLRIYYDYPLTYGELGTHSVGAEEEEEVLQGGFSKERTPSLMEQTLRYVTHGSLWEKDCKILNMRPEDYDTAKAPDTPMWRAYKKYVGFCREVPTIGAPVLLDVQATVTLGLKWETKSRRSRDGLFPPVAEEFSWEDLQRDKLQSWM